MCAILEEITQRCDDAIYYGQFDQLITVLETYHDHTHACNVCHAQTLFYRAVWIAQVQHDVEQASVLLNALIDSPRVDVRLRARTLTFEATLLDQRDRYSTALAKHQEAADVCATAGDYYGLARALYSQAIILSNRLAKSETALRLLDRAEAALQDVDDPIILARILNERGLALMYQHNWSQARAAFERSFQLCAEQGHAEYMAVCEVNFGNLEREQGLLDSAVRWYACALARDEIDWESRGEALLHRSAIAQQQGQPEVARSYLEALLQLARGRPSYHFLALAFLALARLSVTEDDHQGALPLYRSALEAVEQIQSAQDVVTVRLDFQAQWRRLYVEAVACALRLGQTAEALQLSEYGRSRLLLDTIGLQPDTDDQHAPLELVLEQEHLRQELRDAYLRSLTDPHNTTHHRDIEVIECRIGVLQEDLSRYTQNHVPVRTPPMLEHIQQALPDQGLMLIYVQHADGTSVFGVDHQQILHRILPIPMELISGRLNEHGQVHHLLPDAGARLRKHLPILSLLYDAFVAPVQDWLAGHTKIYIVPAPDLRHIPFHLLSPTVDQISPLMQDSRLVRYLPSSSILTRIAPLQINGPLLAIGSNYPNLMLIEAHIVAVAAHTQGQTLRSHAATRLAIQQGAHSAGQLYLAGHNRFSANLPDDGGLVLGGPSLLSLSDIRRLPLIGKRVVIGACQSGLVAERGGEWIGLTSALLQAGASQVIGTLWDVSEVATCVLMDRFWERLTPETDSLVALQQAQQMMRTMTADDIVRSFSGYDLSPVAQQYLESQIQALIAAYPNTLYPLDHPYYWGAYVVVGA